MRTPAAHELVAEPGPDHVHVGLRRAYAGDVGVDGTLRLDGIARLLQDVAGDELEGVEGIGPGWVVRRMLVVVERPPRLRDHLELRTFCSGVGSRWAERRTTIRSERGACVETATLWVHIDVASGRPQTIPAGYLDRVAPEARQREVTARLHHPTELPTTAVAVPWRVRTADLDVLGHVNNAIAGAAVEEVLAAVVGPGARIGRAELEYRSAVDPGADVELHGAVDDDGTLRVWLLAAGALAAGRTPPADAVHVTAVVTPVLNRRP